MNKKIGITVKRSWLTILGLVIGVSTIAGCATDHLGTPCPNFGSGCTKTSINVWK